MYISPTQDGSGVHKHSMGISFEHKYTRVIFRHGLYYYYMQWMCIGTNHLSKSGYVHIIYGHMTFSQLDTSTSVLNAQLSEDDAITISERNALDRYRYCIIPAGHNGNDSWQNGYREIDYILADTYITCHGVKLLYYLNHHRLSSLPGCHQVKWPLTTH